MRRLDWELAGDGSFRASYTHVESDDALVNLVEQDFKQAVRSAGIDRYEAICLLLDPEEGAGLTCDVEFRDRDGDFGSTG